MKTAIKVVIGLSFLLYAFVMIMLLFFDYRGTMGNGLSFFEQVKSSSNFVPFDTIRTYLQVMLNGSMNRDIPIKNLAGNIILFIPIGIYLPFFMGRARKLGAALLFMMLILLLIESIQLVTRRGVFDIDDFILNMSGALIGFAIWRIKIVQKWLT